MSDPSVLVVTDRGDRPETGLLIALHQAGVRLKVLGWSESPYVSSLEEAGVPFEPLRLLGKRDASGTEVIRWHLDDFRPQILHLLRNNAISNGLEAAKGRRVRIVLHRGVVGRLSIVNPLDWTTFLSPRVDKIICAAEVVRQRFLELGFGPLKVPAGKLVTIHEGHDLDWYRLQPLDLALLGVPRDAFVVGCVTNARPRRGIPVLIRATQHLPADLPIHFVLVGRGMAAPRIARRVERSPYRDRFHVLGAREDAAQIAAACNVSVAPSLRPEGLPKPIIESMAYETAPIVTDTGGNRELVEHERSGLVVPAGNAKALADAILRLYADRELCRRLGRNARRRIASEFTVAKAAARTLSVYRGLTAPTINVPGAA